MEWLSWKQKLALDCCVRKKKYEDERHNVKMCSERGVPVYARVRSDNSKNSTLISTVHLKLTHQSFGMYNAERYTGEEE